MLCNLEVENYALISKLDIEFRKGLTIITGETGAGKSILLGALALILGKRADTTVLLDKQKKCIVEGTFDITQYDLRSFFEEKVIDYEDQLYLRREIAATGKSRAFINDTPVTLDVMAELGFRLIDIHSQHQNLNLAESAFQMNVIDSFAHDGDILRKYQSDYNTYQENRIKYTQLCEEAERSKTDLDYFLFQHKQLDEAKLVEGEQEELEQELEKLTHAEDIKSALAGASNLLQGESGAILQQLKECLGYISRVSRFLSDGDNLVKRLDNTYIELKDVARDTEILNSQLLVDPQRLSKVGDRLNVLYSLEKKHRLSSVEELIALREHLKTRIQETESIDFNISRAQEDLEKSRQLLAVQASELQQKRQEAVGPLERKITEMLREVGIPHAAFRVKFDRTDDFTLRGTDKVQFLFSANKNMPLQDISKVASGGELSRLMLCIKSLLYDSTGLPTIIFDEIDTGVSGEIAERVGNIINRMAERMQIINITHLPQVASKGKYHYLVYKTEEARSTVTRMRLLNDEERRIEIAKMLSGEEITLAAMENARALLGN
jgi:DNA repair protein RecN (Recombination protein N)